jgi:predicted HicB family RNase H-like nuclease
MGEAGRPIPPRSVEPTESYSGKWQLRAPNRYVVDWPSAPSAKGVSLNTLAVTLLAEGLGERTGRER